MEIGIVSSHLIWRYRTRHDHRAAKAAGKSYDDYIKSMQLPTVNPGPEIHKSSLPVSTAVVSEMSYDQAAIGRSDHMSTSRNLTEHLDGALSVTIPPPVHVRTGDKVENRRGELQDMV